MMMDCAKKIFTNKNVYSVYAIGHIRVSLWIPHWIHIGKRLQSWEFLLQVYFSTYIFLVLENKNLMIKNGRYLSAFLGVDAAAVSRPVSPIPLAVATFLPI